MVAGEHEHLNIVFLAFMALIGRNFFFEEHIRVNILVNYFYNLKVKAYIKERIKYNYKTVMDDKF